MQWALRGAKEWSRVLAANPESGPGFGLPPTGDVQALLTLADDVYRLCLIDQLPDTILNRLRDIREFQGVRHEITLAASLVRAGVRISWLESN